VSFLFVLQDSPFGVLIGIILIGIFGFAWYRYMRDRTQEGRRDHFDVTLERFEETRW
jgi:hypothetical protein